MTTATYDRLVTPEPSDALLGGTFERLDPRIRTVWAVGRAVAVAVVGMALGVLALVAGETASTAVVLLLTVVGMGLAVVSAGWSWRCWSWAAWDDALEIHHGVVIRASSLVPYHRIQQIDVHRGPLERLLSLSTLILRTAASTTDARIPGVPASRVETLRHQLLARAGIDDAV